MGLFEISLVVALIVLAGFPLWAWLYPHATMPGTSSLVAALLAALVILGIGAEASLGCRATPIVCDGHKR